MATLDQKKTKFLKTLKDGPKKAATIAKELGWSPDEIKKVGQALIKDGKIEAGENKTLQLAAPKKKTAPVKKSTPAPKRKAKPEPEDEDEDEDEDDDEDSDDEDEDEEDGSDEDEDEDEDSEDEDDDDDSDPDEDDEDADDDEDDDGGDDDEDEDDEDEAPPVKKGKKGAKAPVKKAKKTDVPFSVAYKPIDMLLDDELESRIADSTEVAEQLNGDYPEVAEMLMRSVARARKQLHKRGKA